MTQPGEISISPKSPSPKLSRKQKRRQLSPTLPEYAISTPESQILIPSPLSQLLAPQMAAPARLLICSIGNPAPLTSTLHSAGHLVLSSLANQLSYPSFQKSRLYGNGLVSVGPEFTLWQSTSYMNVSGVGVAAAWRQFVKDNASGYGSGNGGEGVKLVVVHDELELKVGEVKVKKGTASAKGHNGLKSINEKLKGTGMEYTRIAVGIGRPEARDPESVAGYVLRKMNVLERAKIEGAVGRVFEEVRALAGGGR